MNRVFKIHALKNTKVDADYDAYSLPFKGRDMIGAHMMGIKEFDYPERIFFYADFLSIPSYDYIIIDLTFHVMSRRMLNVLTQKNNPEYTAIPVTMIDDRYLNDPFNERGHLNPDVHINNDYFAIHIKEYADVFSYEESVFKPDIVFSEDVGEIEKLVLKHSVKGFPSFFKLKELRPFLFINEETRDELKRQKVIGCFFEEIAVSMDDERGNIVNY